MPPVLPGGIRRFTEPHHNLAEVEFSLGRGLLQYNPPPPNSTKPMSKPISKTRYAYV
jgi:hypothetical protein